MGRLTIEQIIEHCEKTTKEYEEKVSDLFPIERTQSNRYWEHKQVAEYLKELQKYEDLEEQGRLIETPETGIGNLSDGYHTFNELYHHRAVLFSVICNAFKSCAWKSKKHSDGTMYDGMFIVGIDTPEGSATYHYDIEPYWNMFDIKELDNAPEWDGHTPDDAISRIAGLSKSNRLIELPCAVGDTMYIPNERFPAEIDEIRITPRGIFAEYVQYDRSYELTEVWDGGSFCIEDVGKKVFFTQEEAERKLKELE